MYVTFKKKFRSKGGLAFLPHFCDLPKAFRQQGEGMHHIGFSSTQLPFLIFMPMKTFEGVDGNGNDTCAVRSIPPVVSWTMHNSLKLWIPHSPPPPIVLLCQKEY